MLLFINKNHLVMSDTQIPSSQLSSNILEENKEISCSCPKLPPSQLYQTLTRSQADLEGKCIYVHMFLKMALSTFTEVENKSDALAYLLKEEKSEKIIHGAFEELKEFIHERWTRKEQKEKQNKIQSKTKIQASQVESNYKKEEDELKEQISQNQIYENESQNLLDQCIIEDESYLTEKPSSYTQFNLQTSQNQILSKPQKQPQFFSYLLALPKAQTQISYLCQWKNWELDFHDGKSLVYQKKYACTAEVSIQFQEKVFAYYGNCYYARSKKEAKHIASLFCLEELYMKVEGLFEEFLQLKKQKPQMSQSLNADNSYFYQKKEPAFLSYQIKKNPFQKDEINLINYFSKMKNYKLELQNFVGRNGKQFLRPSWKMKLVDFIGIWEIQLIVAYQINNNFLEYREKVKHSVKKEGQMMVAKEVLMKIAQDFPSLYQKYIKSKTKQM